MNQKLGGRKKGLRKNTTLQDHLERQIRYLRRSCALVDAGHEDEAQRIAVTLRVLLHDTRKSKSLLSQLGVKSTCQFVDAGLYRDELNNALEDWVKQNQPGKAVCVMLGEPGLVVEGINAAGQPAWIAPLATPRLPPQHPAASTIGISKPFEPWWTKPIVETSEMRYFSRERLILIMANEDGGAHVDPELDEEYEALTVDNLGMHLEIGHDLQHKLLDGDIPAINGNVAAASVRQIAFEVLQTLRPEDDNSGPVQRVLNTRPIMVIGTPVVSPDNSKSG